MGQRNLRVRTMNACSHPCTSHLGCSIGPQDLHLRLQLMQLAARVAINRQVAGVHTPMESAAGAVLGLTLGEYLVARCTQADAATPHRAWAFDGTAYPDQGDLEWGSLFSIASGQTETDYARNLDPAGKPLGAPSPTLAWLWDKAVAEWH